MEPADDFAIRANANTVYIVYQGIVRMPKLRAESGHPSRLRSRMKDPAHCDRSI